MVKLNNLILVHGVSFPSWKMATSTSPGYAALISGHHQLLTIAQDHVRIGYLYLTRYDFGEALHRITLGIQRHAAAHGQPQKYHETITVAFMAVMNERLRAEDVPGDWPEFAAANPDLFDKGLLLRYYTAEELASPRARQVFMLSRAAG